MKLADTLLRINKAVRTQKSYHLCRRDVPVKLNQNENPFDWPAEIKEEVAQFSRERPWNRYPPFIPNELKTMLGDYIDMPAECILTGNGSNEILLILMLSFTSKGKPVILCQPTFTVYRFLVEGTGGTCHTVNLNQNMQFDIDAILAASARAPEAPLIICSPNNPTGASLGETALRTILTQHRGMVIVDQAYIEFGGYNAIPLISTFPNLLVARTFSKAFAGAGLRVGYCTGNVDVIAEISKIKLPYNLNFFSEFVARTALRHRKELSKGIVILRNERDLMHSFLTTLPLTVFPSDANFILIRSSHKQQLFDALLNEGILIRDVSSYPMLDSCLRISIGTPEENQLLKNALNRFFATAHDKQQQ